MQRRACLLVLLCLLPFACSAFGCTFAYGNFRQVTHLRGKVVGVSIGDFRHWFRWTRHLVAREDAKLKLYKHRGEFTAYTNAFREVETGRGGEFDFGELPVGRDVLVIRIPWGKDGFEVEITESKQTTKSILIDTSPVYPDCTGGHEFIVNHD